MQNKNTQFVAAVYRVNGVRGRVEGDLPRIQHSAVHRTQARGKIDRVRSHRVHIGIEAAEAVDRIGCPQVAKRIPGGGVDAGSGQNQSALWDVYSGGELSCG